MFNDPRQRRVVRRSTMTEADEQRYLDLGEALLDWLKSKPARDVSELELTEEIEEYLDELRAAHSRFQN